MGKVPANRLKQPLSFGAVPKLCAAVVLYGAFSVYLFRPYLANLSGYEFLNVLNPVLAAWGAYFLSRRWVNHWTPSLLAGAVYGFSPFALSFASFPAAGLSYVMVPWLFLPSLYWHKNKTADGSRFIVRSVFVLLPFAGIAGLFWASSQKWAGPYFLMPVTLHLTLRHFCDLVFPLYQRGEYLTFGIYHGPVILAIMGAFVLVSIQRIAVMIPVAAAMVLCFLNPMLQVPPIVWASIVVLFLAILAGLGFEALLLTGKSDNKWVLACAMAASVVAAFFGGLAYKRLILGGLLEWTALTYTAMAAALWILLFFARTGHRWRWSRWLVLTAAVVLDVIFSARYLVDKLF